MEKIKKIIEREIKDDAEITREGHFFTAGTFSFQPVFTDDEIRRVDTSDGFDFGIEYLEDDLTNDEKIELYEELKIKFNEWIRDEKNAEEIAEAAAVFENMG